MADFIREPAIRDELCVQQALVAAHFGLLYLAWLDEKTQEVVAYLAWLDEQIQEIVP